MDEMKRIVVSGEEIVNNPVLDISTTLSQSNYFLLTGTVYTPDGKPLPKAAVAVYIVMYSNNLNQKQLIGVTFTVEDGTYGISLPVGYTYSLTIYS